MYKVTKRSLSPLLGECAEYGLQDNKDGHARLLTRNIEVKKLVGV